MITSMHRNWQDVEKKHYLFLRGILHAYFLKCEDTMAPLSPCYYFLKRVRKFILSRNIRHHIKSIRMLETFRASLGSVEQGDRLIKDLKKVINYDRFTDKKSSYNAYDLCLRSKSQMCMYCHHSYSFTIIRKGRGFRPTLDHYFDKDRYPHLALTLYNLVPACSNCNSSLKGTINFYEDEHLNPLFDDESIKFRLATKTALDPLEIVKLTQDDFSIAIDYAGAKAKRSVETFLIPERYQQFKYEALRMAKAKLAFDDLMTNKDLLLKRTMTEETTLRFDKRNYKNEMLGRLFYDVYQQFVLIKTEADE